MIIENLYKGEFMKNLLFIISMVFAANVFAENTPGIELTMKPSSPVVINTDFDYFDENTEEYVVVKGPWFRFSYSIQNETFGEISLFALELKILGTNYEVVELYNELKVAPYSSFDLNFEHYISALPLRDNFKHEVEVKLIGYTSEIDGPTNRLHLIKRFTTQ